MSYFKYSGIKKFKYLLILCAIFSASSQALDLQNGIQVSVLSPLQTKALGLNQPTPNSAAPATFHPDWKCIKHTSPISGGVTHETCKPILIWCPNADQGECITIESNAPLSLTSVEPREAEKYKSLAIPSASPSRLNVHTSWRCTTQVNPGVIDTSDAVEMETCKIALTVCTEEECFDIN